MWTVRGSVHARVRSISFFKISRPALDPPALHLVLWISRGQAVPPVVKSLGYEAHRPTSNTEMKNEWSCTSTRVVRGTGLLFGVSIIIRTLDFRPWDVAIRLDIPVLDNITP